MTGPDPPTATDQLHLRTLGTCVLQQVASDGGMTTLLESSKLLALLLYLNCAPARSATRDHLVNLLWSDRDDEGGRKALRQLLWLLRQRFGDAITIDRVGETLRLTAPIRCDRDEFRDASASGDLVRAVSLYRGDFFPSFAAAGAQEFEHWIERERTGLRLTFVQSAQLLVRSWLDQGRGRDAAALARRARDADPFDQSGWRLLVETLVASRDLIGASVEADTLERLAREENFSIDAPTRATLASVRSPGGSGVASGDAPMVVAARELVGREAEFALLLRRADQAAKGRRQLVRVTGPAGIGKSRLLQEFGARLRSTRREVISVRAQWTSRTLPLTFISDVIEALVKAPGALGVSPRAASVLVGLTPSASAVFRNATPSAERGGEIVARRAAFRELLATVCDEHALTLVLDDMHWCDPASRQLLLTAVDGLERTRLLVLLADRSSVADDLPGSTLSIPLGTLSPQGVTALVASIADLPEEQWAREMCDTLALVSAGSPLHVLESLQLAVQQGALKAGGGAWQASNHEQLIALLRGGEIVRARLQSLGQNERRVMLALARAGGVATPGLLAECMEQDVDSCLRMFEGLERSGLVVRAGSTFAIAHDEIAEHARTLLADPSFEARLGDVAAGRASTAVDMVAAATLLNGAPGSNSRALLFRRFVALQRQRGDRRPVADHAGALLGPSATADEVRMLLSGLGLWQRLGLDMPGRALPLIALALIALLGAGASLVRTPARPSAAIITAIRADSLGFPVADEYLLPRGWEYATGTMRLQPGTRNLRIAVPGVERTLAPPHDSLPFILVRQLGDSLLTDLFEYGQDGALRQLTRSPGDDTSPSWAPDGSAIAFATARWDSLGRRDVAILDRSTGGVTRVTTDAQTGAVWWSPSGHQLAYESQRGETRGMSVCVADLSDANRRCFPLGTPSLSLIGWSGDEALFLHFPPTPGLIRLDLTSGDTTRVSRGEGAFLAVGLEGSFLCHCLDESRSEHRWVLTSSGGVSVPLELGSEHRSTGAFTLLTARSPKVRSWIKAIALPDTVVLRVGVPTSIIARVVHADSAASRRWRVKWSTSDSSVIRITPDGQLVGLLEGASATVTADVGGWRRDTAVVVVRPAVDEVLLKERWDRPIGHPWRPFGKPMPQTARGGDGSFAFLNNGDGRFNSGVYSRNAFPTADGLALRTRLSGVIDRGQWQVQQLELRAGLDVAELSRWDHRNGYLWGEDRLNHVKAPGCELRYPGGPEGSSPEGWLMAGKDVVPVDAARLARGEWFDVVLQWLPDGRCAYLVDGELVAVSDARARADSAQVVVFGNSVGTTMRVGAVTVLRGVAPEVARRLLAMQ